MNTLQHIEHELTALELDNRLYSVESLSLISQWVCIKSGELINRSEELSVPKELLLQAEENFWIAGNPAPPIETLFVFVHGGLDIPSAYGEFFGFSNWRSIAESLLVNNDSGVRWFAQRLINEMATSSKPYQVAFYNISRVAADTNRLVLKDQIVDAPYRGQGMWKADVDKKRLSKELIDPFFEAVEHHINVYNPKFIFFPHTYDTVGGGNASSGHEIGGALKRPASSIVDYFNVYGSPFGHYKNDTYARFHFLRSEENLQRIKEIVQKGLDKMHIPGENMEVTIDYPYLSPAIFNSLIGTYTQSPQLVLEFRKDLFSEWGEVLWEIIKGIF